MSIGVGDQSEKLKTTKTWSTQVEKGPWECD